MGDERCRKGRAADPQPCAPAGAGRARRLSLHPGRSRRDADSDPARLASVLRRSLACTNIIENMMGTIRRVCRNVKRWRDASMALRWTAAAMQEATKGFRRLKAHKQLPVLRAALAAHQATHRQPDLEPTPVAA